MYGYELLELLSEEQMEVLGREGMGMPVDMARASEDPAYVLDVFDAAPVGLLHVMEELSGGQPVDWQQLTADAGEEPAEEEEPPAAEEPPADEEPAEDESPEPGLPAMPDAE